MSRILRSLLLFCFIFVLFKSLRIRDFFGIPESERNKKCSNTGAPKMFCFAEKQEVLATKAVTSTTTIIVSLC